MCEDAVSCSSSTTGTLFPESKYKFILSSIVSSLSSTVAVHVSSFFSRDINHTSSCLVVWRVCLTLDTISMSLRFF